MNHEARCAGPAQVAQARTILSRMAALQAEAGRPTWVMLAGDFNSVPGSAIYRCFECAAGMLIWQDWQHAILCQVESPPGMYISKGLLEGRPALGRCHGKGGGAPDQGRSRSLCQAEQKWWQCQT